MQTLLYTDDSVADVHGSGKMPLMTFLVLGLLAGNILTRTVGGSKAESNINDSGTILQVPQYFLLYTALSYSVMAIYVATLWKQTPSPRAMFFQKWVASVLAFLLIGNITLVTDDLVYSCLSFLVAVVLLFAALCYERSVRLHTCHYNRIEASPDQASYFQVDVPLQYFTGWVVSEWILVTVACFAKDGNLTSVFSLANVLVVVFLVVTVVLFTESQRVLHHLTAYVAFFVILLLTDANERNPKLVTLLSSLLAFISAFAIKTALSHFVFQPRLTMRFNDT